LAGAQDWQFEDRRRLDAAGPRCSHVNLRCRSASGTARESTFSAFDCRTTRTHFFERQLMKNLAKFLLFVLLISAGISLLYDYRLKHGTLNLAPSRKPEKYTLASTPSVDSKQVASLDALNRERRALVNSVIPSVVAVNTSKKISIRREYGLDPF